MGWLIREEELGKGPFNVAESLSLERVWVWNSLSLGFGEFVGIDFDVVAGLELTTFGIFFCGVEGFVRWP